MTDQETLDAQIKQRGDLITTNDSISANNAARIRYINTLIPSPGTAADYAEAHKVSDQIDQDEAIRAGNAAKIASLDASIKALQASIAAQTALVNANANLSPAQLTQLQLNAQNTAAAAAAAKAKADADANSANYKAANTKYYLIAAVVVVLFIAAFVIFSRNKKGKAKVAEPQLAIAA